MTQSLRISPTNPSERLSWELKAGPSCPISHVMSHSRCYFF